MAVLCLDTSSTHPLAVLLGETADDDRGIVGSGRAQELLVLVDELRAGRDRSALTAVVVGTGPGGFTGLRIGVATARGIAETLHVPLHGVSSLLALAAADALARPEETVWAVLDARRGECFVQPFVARDGMVAATGGLRVVAADAVDEVIGGGIRTTDAGPSPRSLAAAARQVLAGRATGDPLEVLPAYGREPDASPPRARVRVDHLREQDLDALVALEERCFPIPWTRRMYMEELRRPAGQRVQLAARDGDVLAGAALAARIGDSWHVMNVLVEPALRRRGVARLLLRQLLEETARRGAGDGWTLEVRDGNEAAIGLYRELGFVIAGRRPGYYQDSGEDAIVMWRRGSGIAERAPESAEARGARR